MDAAEIKSWIGVVASLSALIVGLVTALWAYTKFVLERGLLPPSQFDVECTPVGLLGGKKLLEVVLHLRNVGTSTLIASDIRVDVLYLERQDLPTLFSDARFGRLALPHSVRADLAPAEPPRYRKKPIPPSRWRRLRWVVLVRRAVGSMTTRRVAAPGEPAKQPRGITVVPYDTFVQAGVDQLYTFPTAVPESAAFVLIWSSFRYAQSPKPLQRAVLAVSRRLGLVQFTLRHVTAPHTVERLFSVDGQQEPSGAAGGDRSVREVD